MDTHRARFTVAVATLTAVIATTAAVLLNNDRNNKGRVANETADFATAVLGRNVDSLGGGPVWPIWTLAGIAAVAAVVALVVGLVAVLQTPNDPVS